MKTDNRKLNCPNCESSMERNINCIAIFRCSACGWICGPDKNLYHFYSGEPPLDSNGF